MAGSTASAAAAERHAGSVAFVLSIVGAAVLAGLGLALMAYWLITLSWWYFAGLIPLVLGALLLFSRLSGPDRA